jgi:hypothetical protein
VQKVKLSYVVTAGAVSIASSIALAQPARAADFEQTWNSSAQYRASNDFIPGARGVDMSGKGCPGETGVKWSISLMKTSGSEKLWTSGLQPADNVWRWTGYKEVPTGTAYYFRWRGVFNGGGNKPLPCQGVQANW